MPIDAIVIDYFRWTEQGEWKFDHKYWPDPEGMCKELEAMGIKPIVSIMEEEQVERKVYLPVGDCSCGTEPVY